MWSEKSEAQKKIYGKTVKEQSKPFFTLIRPGEAQKLASILLWYVALQAKEADQGAYHINVTYGLKEQDLVLLQEDMVRSANPPPPTPTQPEPTPDTPPKKKTRTTTK